MSEQIIERTDAISIELCAHPMDDGRMYVTSDTLKGFRFVIEEGDDFESLKEAIIPFLSAYLNVKIDTVRPVMTPQAYRQRALNLPPHQTRRMQFVAEACAA